VARLLFGFAISALAVRGQIILAQTGVDFPLALVYPAVMVAAWVGGSAAGVVAILVSAAGLDYFVMPPNASLAIEARRDLLDLGTFVILSAVLVYFIGRVRRALRDARASRAIAEAATVAKESMIAIVAHDLRNPLQTVALNAEFLAATANLDERTRPALDRLRRSAERACRLAEDIVENADVSASFPLQKAPCKVSDVLDEALPVFEHLASARAMNLERPTGPALDAAIVCDKDRLVQVLTNLLSNAFQFTPAGGRVRVDARQTPDGFRFEVADTGRGMTRDELSHAFDKLWHGAEPGHGLGLGLWIAETLVEAHGSHLSATSEVGKGTTMGFVLPKTPAMAYSGANLR
jgi:signal transduction histidine kinase